LDGARIIEAGDGSDLVVHQTGRGAAGDDRRAMRIGIDDDSRIAAAILFRSADDLEDIAGSVVDPDLLRRSMRDPAREEADVPRERMRSAVLQSQRTRLLRHAILAGRRAAARVALFFETGREVRARARRVVSRARG